MDILENIQHTDTGAHAYLLRASVEEMHERIVKYITEKNNVTRSNSDVYIVQTDVLTVDDARAIQQFASFKPVGKYKYIVISAKHINTEAQHALLKVVEEGVGKSIFYIVLEPGSPVLETLCSRCVVLTDNTDTSAQYSKAEEFLSMSYHERLQCAEHFSKNQDREGARNLVRQLLRVAHNKKFNKEKLRDLLEADQYLQLSGSSPKGVIGHLALII